MQWRIKNTKSGADLGAYGGANEEEALDTMARAAGYPDHATAKAQMHLEPGELKVTRADEEQETSSEEEPVVDPDGWTKLVCGGSVCCEGGVPVLVSDGGADGASSEAEANKVKPRLVDVERETEDLLGSWIDPDGTWEPPDMAGKPFELVCAVVLAPEQPTHRVTFKAASGGVTTWLVRLSLGPGAEEADPNAKNGPAYTHEEWEDALPADWEVHDGAWFFQGRSTPGGEAGVVDVVRIERRGDPEAPAGGLVASAYVVADPREAGAFSGLDAPLRTIVGGG